MEIRASVIEDIAIATACRHFALASSTLLVKCSSTTCKLSVIAFFPDDLSRTPYRFPPTQATRKQRTNKLGRCCQPECLFCTLARYSLPTRTAPLTYMCLSAQVSGGETRVHAGRWHTERSLKNLSPFHFTFYFLLLFFTYPINPLLHFTLLFISTTHFSSLVFTFLTLVLKVCVLLWEVPITPSGSLFQSVMGVFTKEYFPMSFLCSEFFYEGNMYCSLSCFYLL